MGPIIKCLYGIVNKLFKEIFSATFMRNKKKKKKLKILIFFPMTFPIIVY